MTECDKYAGVGWARNRLAETEQLVCAQCTPATAL